MRNILAVLFLLLAVSHTLASPARSAGNFRGIVTSTGCPYGSGLGDGCGTSPGLFFAPAVNSTTQPSAAQWSTYARQSGQTWTSNHPQTFNLAGVDYGVGPNIAIASMTDVATWTPGTNGCTYYNGTTSQYISSNWTATNPVLACTGNGGNPYSITNQMFGPVGGRTFCVGLLFDYLVTNELVTIQNNAWVNAAGSGVGSCNLTGGMIKFRNGALISGKIWNNYFDGKGFDACCGKVSTNGSPFFSSVRYKGNIDLQYNYLFNLPTVIANMNWDGGNGTSCGVLGAGSGNNVTIAHNYTEGFITYAGGGHGEFMTYNMNTISSLTATQTGTSLVVTAASTTINNGDFYFGPGVPYGSYIVSGGPGTTGTYTVSTSANTGSVAMGTYNGIICDEEVTYNTILWPSTYGGSGTTTFYGPTNGQGTVHKFNIANNTVILNLTGGAQVPDTADNWDFQTTAGNQIQITGQGSSCSPNCKGPFQGAALSGQGMGLQEKVSGSGVGSIWNAGCTTPGGTQCPSLTYSIVGTPTVSGTNTQFLNVPVVPGGLFALQHASYGAVLASTNFIDPTGTQNPVGIADANSTCGTATAFSSNINLLTGDGTSVNALNSNTSHGC